MQWNLNNFTKIAFSRLIQPFGDNLNDVVKITKAFSFAASAYSGIFRNESHEPYINHAMKVALILSDELKVHDVDTICAAILHDAIEKSKENSPVVEDLRSNFGDNIYDTVRILTEPKTNEENREKLLFNYFDNISKGPKMPRFIKLADRLDNARFLKNDIKKEKALRYKEETQKYILPLAEKTDDTIALKLSIALYEIK
ncbi:MAG TPA: HD domain-containing protein [Nitrososphaeraceae archaeon]|jgi:GTP pyrophosphokinase|nr:HD domain-containing protein [Nitrososphaeraceae archaeon]HJR84897.1 HD domain-containing protein [Nitrososphaeraceae archaeon]